VNGVFYKDLEGWWRMVWPEFGVNSIYQERGLGKAEFWQMIMLDNTTASAGGLTYYSYPNEDVDRSLPALGGADPTTFDTDTTTKRKKRSHFALAHAVKLPTGGAVITGGVLEQCSLAQAENHILDAQGRFTNWLGTYVENVSVGKVALQAWKMNPAIRVYPSGLKDITDGKISSKKARIEAVSKYFEDMTIRISDADTPFLNALRRLFDNFEDMDEKSHDEAWDAGDAVFHIVRNMPDVLRRPTWTDKALQRGAQRQKKRHPLMGIRDYRGYG
jgi:hypothetical protein